MPELQDTKQEDKIAGDKQQLEKKKKKEVEIKKQVKQNKIFYYGFPALVMVAVFVSLFFFIIPTINTFLESRSTNATLDENYETVTKSIGNLRRAQAEESMITDYDAQLTEYVPVKPAVGDIIHMIQTKANDFNLETTNIGAARGGSRTSVGNIATRDQDDDAIFESIASGEIEFQPDALSTEAKAYLISIEITVNGDKQSFLDFLEEMKNVKPLTNLVYVEYSEEDTDEERATTDDSVEALVRFESYALNLDITNLELRAPRQYTKDDSSLFTSIPEEKFEWSRDMGDYLNDSTAEN